MDMNDCDLYAHMVHLFMKLIEVCILVSGLSTAWEETAGFEK